MYECEETRKGMRKKVRERDGEDRSETGEGWRWRKKDEKGTKI